jgi:hypothetical protein
VAEEFRKISKIDSNESYLMEIWSWKWFNSLVFDKPHLKYW